MVTGPEDAMGVPAAGHGRMRASDADRERVVDVLKAAFVQGRLVKDELDARAGRVFASRTYAELAALTADIPPAPRRPADRWTCSPRPPAVQWTCSPRSRRLPGRPRPGRRRRRQSWDARWPSSRPSSS